MPKLSISKQPINLLSLTVFTACLLSCIATKINSTYPLQTGVALWKLGMLSEEEMYYRYYEDCESKLQQKRANIIDEEPVLPIEQDIVIDEHEQEVVPKMTNLTKEESSHKTIFLIRHAQSQYNAAIAKVRKSLEGTGKDETAIEIALTKYSEELIDAAITEEGERQVQKLLLLYLSSYYKAAESAELLNDKNIGIVITSPLRRCLQTTRKIFENHKNKPKVIVYPLIKEITSSSCDLPSDLNEIKKEFPDYDFTAVDEHPAKELWFIDILENEEQKKGLLDELYRLYPEKEDAIKNASKFLAKKMLENFPNEFEALVDLNKRVTKAKKWLKEKLNEVNDGEFMAVVTHSKVLQSFIAKEYGELGEFIGSRRLVNCEIMEYNL